MPQLHEIALEPEPILSIKKGEEHQVIGPDDAEFGRGSVARSPSGRLTP